MAILLLPFPFPYVLSTFAILTIPRPRSLNPLSATNIPLHSSLVLVVSLSPRSMQPLFHTEAPPPLSRHNVSRYQTAISITTTANYRTKPGDEFTGRSTCFMQLVGRQSEYCDAVRAREVNARIHARSRRLIRDNRRAVIWHAIREKSRLTPLSYLFHVNGIFFIRK